MFANMTFRRVSTRRELAVALIGAALAWLVATVVVAQSTNWSLVAIAPLALLFGLLVAAVNVAIASDPSRSWPSVLGRVAVGLLVGVVVGELAALVLFSGSIDRRLDAQAARGAASSPAVVQAQANVDRARATQTALDQAVEQARAHRDQALVVARCEYNPSPACPQTRITGVPGPGPETHTANELLADSQRELDTALAARDRQATEVRAAEQAVQQASGVAAADADRGLGARWVAMHHHTLASAAAMVLWAATIAFFVLLSLLPLILKLLRGDTTAERGAAANAERERAEIDADTAIAVKRAEVRAAIETLWAEQQLTSARLAVEAQNEIDREMHRRRVAEALNEPLQVTAERVNEDEYLPSAAEVAALDAPQATAPLLPAVTKTAARWIRPFVPPVVARAIGTTTKPLRTARHMFEEVEEVTFSFKRTYRATSAFEEGTEPMQPSGSATQPRPEVRHVESSRITEHSSPEKLRRAAHPRELPRGE